MGALPEFERQWVQDAVSRELGRKSGEIGIEPSRAQSILIAEGQTMQNRGRGKKGLVGPARVLGGMGMSNFSGPRKDQTKGF